MRPTEKGLAVPSARLTFIFRQNASEAAAAEQIALGEDQVHIWQGPLEGVAGTDLAQFNEILSESERERASRFRFEKHRNEFVVCRGRLRLHLANYLKISPKEIEIRYTEYGKPELAGMMAALQFNVSHSGGEATYAFTRGRRVGVDLEKMRDDVNVEELAARFFSAAETENLRELTPEERRDAFFRCWTRKEAYIKAIGEGLSHPLHQFDVSLQPGDLRALLRTRPDPAEASRWVLRDLPAGGGYAAAVAVESIGTAAS